MSTRLANARARIHTQAHETLAPEFLDTTLYNFSQTIHWLSSGGHASRPFPALLCMT